MRYYSVHAPAEATDDPERFAFVKDGFSWPALFVPVLWILWHRLWLALVWYIVFVLIVAWTGRLASEDAAMVVAFARRPASCARGQQYPPRWRCENRGWDEVGASFGRNLDEAEARFFGRARQPAGRAWIRLDRRAAMLRAAYAPEHGCDDRRRADPRALSRSRSASG